MTGFSVTVQSAADGATVMCLGGEADLSTTALREALAAEIARSPRLLLVDLAALTFIDSGATQMIIGAYHALSLNGGALALIHPRAAVARVLELTGISQVIPVYDNVNEAIAAVR
jgi:anti-anti-sigma factor